MKNKNGFTLIELVAVIALIAVVGVVIVVSITSQVKKQVQSSYEAFEETVLNSAELYIEQHRKLYPELVNVNDSIYITIEDVMGANLLDRNLRNPKTDDFVDKKTRIKVTIGEDNILIYELEEK